MNIESELGLEICKREIQACSDIEQVRETAIELLSLFVRQRALVREWIDNGWFN